MINLPLNAKAILFSNILHCGMITMVSRVSLGSRQDFANDNLMRIKMLTDKFTEILKKHEKFNKEQIFAQSSFSIKRNKQL